MQSNGDHLISEIKGVGRPATESLKYHLNVTKLSQLTEYTKKELLALHGIGPKAIKVLAAELEKLGLSFKK